MRVLRAPCIAAVLIVGILACLSLYLSHGRNGLLRVVFLDVGQGDATFIESPSGVQVLIDGGVGKAVLSPLSRYLGFFDRDIDMIIATHPDADHIGGLIDVLERYHVHTILMTENVNDTPVYDAFLRAVHAEGAAQVFVRAGMQYDLGLGVSGSTTLRILFPDTDPTTMESNMSSIIAQLMYASSTYLFTGDAPASIEEYIVEREGAALVSDVLKVGHHGSRTSSTEAFVAAVRPSYAIISAGKDNSYGHPHKEVTDLLTQKGIVQKNTADLGSIESHTDGHTILFLG